MSRTQFFYNIVRRTSVQVMKVFEDIVVARYNPETGVVIKYVKVPVMYAPKTKQWYWSELKDRNDRRDRLLPAMAMNLEGLEFASDRQVNRNAKVTISNINSSTYQIYNAVPYDLTYSLTIAAEYMVDITQIVEQVLPFFTPEIYVRLSVPELFMDGTSTNGLEKLDLKLLYEGSSLNMPSDMTEEQYRVLEWTMNFKLQGYLFSPISEVEPIQNIVFNVYDGVDRVPNG